jgi:hypothetical protein
MGAGKFDEAGGRAADSDADDRYRSVYRDTTAGRRSSALTVSTVPGKRLKTHTFHNVAAAAARHRAAALL